MGSSVFFGGSVVAAVVAGTIALMASCCVSVMLPTYFAASFHNRRVMTAMTFVFAAGIATVIVPIALGASLVRRVLIEDHTTVYLLGGLLMVGLGVYTLLGGRLRLPMPGGRPAGRGPLGVYGLGVLLSDPDLAVSRAYSADQYGMMGDTRDGHSFVLVGADGNIVWRADYGGSPDYTMFLPSAALVADMRAGGVKAEG